MVSYKDWHVKEFVLYYFGMIGGKYGKHAIPNCHHGR